MYKIIFLAAFFLLGCSTTSTVSLNDGSVYEGEITRKSADAVQVNTEDAEPFIVKESRIQDIDHPGNVHFWIGTVLSVVGIAGIAFAIPLSLDEDPAYGIDVLMYMASGLVIAIGAPMAIWGGTTWQTAKDKTYQSLTLQPTVFGKDGFSPGLNVKLQF